MNTYKVIYQRHAVERMAQSTVYEPNPEQWESDFKRKKP